MGDSAKFRREVGEECCWGVEEGMKSAKLLLAFGDPIVGERERDPEGESTTGREEEGEGRRRGGDPTTTERE